MEPHRIDSLIDQILAQGAVSLSGLPNSPPSGSNADTTTSSKITPTLNPEPPILPQINETSSVDSTADHIPPTTNPPQHREDDVLSLYKTMQTHPNLQLLKLYLMLTIHLSLMKQSGLVLVQWTKLSVLHLVVYARDRQLLMNVYFPPICASLNHVKSLRR